MHLLTTPFRQRGIATLLIVLLLGLAVSVTVAATIFSLRSNQQLQITTHSVRSAQAAAWRGVEAIRQYLLSLENTTYDSWINDPPSFPLTIKSLSSIGVSQAKITKIEKTTTGYLVMSQVTGVSAEADEKIRTSAIVDVVYNIAAGKQQAGQSSIKCSLKPSVPLVFNTPLDITGGSLAVTNSVNFENIAVNGPISLQNASQASISGCSTGDIFLSGGGIKQNGHLFSYGKITVKSMSPPNGTTLWGKEIVLDGSASNAQYAALQAGGYDVEVLNTKEQVIGHAIVGGKILPTSMTSAALPLSKGRVIPFSNRIIITLNDQSTALVDLALASINANTGEVSNLDSAVSDITGSASLPGSIHFQATGIAGGDIRFEGLSNTQLVWGNSIYAALGLQGFQVQKMLANAELQAGRGTIASLTGGADLWAKGAQGNPLYKNYTNFTRIDSGSIAGSVFYGSDRAALPTTDFAAAGVRIQKQQPVTPGLPGLPYCDVRVESIKANDYKTIANYIFELKDGVPFLTIQNVKTDTGKSLDGQYNLKTTNISRLPEKTGNAFIACYQEPDQWGNGVCRELSQTSATTGWQLSNIYRFPPGVVWFDRSVTINGSQPVLYNTIISAGDVIFTANGSTKTVTAPNFSTAKTICDGSFWPTNLCDKSHQPSLFASWKDTDGATHFGLPVGNLAIGAEGSGSLAGWTLNGHVVLNQTLITSANKAKIQGSLTVGANSNANNRTTITAGGAEVQIPSSSDNSYIPGPCQTNTSTIPGPNTVEVFWSRYL